MVNIMESGLSDVDFARKLLEEEYVATCPGSYFGVYGAGYIRICFATSLDNINTGMLRMKNFLQKINGESKNK
jgi:aminotransferase